MNYQHHKQIFGKCQAKGFSPKHVAEVGVYLPETSNILDFIHQGIRTTLVEPDPDTIKKIKVFFKDYPAVTLHEIALYDYNGTLTLAQRSPSTFASTLEASPALINDHYTMRSEDKFDVPCKTFNEIDPADIDLLSIDIEGGEWYVLKHMKSRPRVLSIETHGKSYINPFIQEILSWVHKENYQVWYKDKSDTVFVRRVALLK